MAFRRTADFTLTTSQSVEEALQTGQKVLESAGYRVSRAGQNGLSAKINWFPRRVVAQMLGPFGPLDMIFTKVNYTVQDQGSTRQARGHVRAGLMFEFWTWKGHKRAKHVAAELEPSFASALQATAQPVG